MNSKEIAQYRVEFYSNLVEWNDKKIEMLKQEIFEQEKLKIHNLNEIEINKILLNENNK